MLTIDVTGTPAPQGSKRAFVVNGRAVMTENSKKVKPWRQDVVAAAQTAAAAHWNYECPDTSCECTPDKHQGWQTPSGPVQINICFYLPRLKAHYGTGRNADRLKDSAPTHSSTKPDLDKLARATLDALTTSAVIKDDAQVARLAVEKRYADGPTGARIIVAPLDTTTSPIPVAAPSRHLGSAGAPTAPTGQEALL